MFNKKNKNNKNEEENSVEEQLDLGLEETEEFEETYDAFDDFEEENETDNSEKVNDDEYEEVEETEELQEDEEEYDDEYEEVEETEELQEDEEEYDDEYEEVEETEELQEDEEEYDDDYEEVEETEELPEDEEEYDDDEYEEVEETEELPEDEEEYDDDEYEEVEETEELQEDEEEYDDDEYEEVEETEELPEDEEEYDDDEYEEVEETEELPEDEEEYDDDYEEVEETEELPEDEEEYDDDEYEEVEETERLQEDEEEYDDDYEEVEETEELPEDEEEYDDDEYEEVEETEELQEDEEEYDDDEYEEVEETEELPEDEEEYDDDYEEVEEIEELPEDEEEYDDDEYEEVEETEELPEDEKVNDDEYEEVEELEELPEDEEYDEVEEIDEELLEDEEENGDENEEVEEIDEIEELPENEEKNDGEQITIKENNEKKELKEEVKNETENTNEDSIEEQEDEEIEDAEAPKQEEIATEINYYDQTLEEELNSDDEDNEDDEEADENADMYPDELIDIELECIYIGLLFNNPKAISRYYLLYDDCRFSNKELSNLYRIIIFRDGEQYAPAAAKDKYQLPRENPKTYDLRWKVRKIASSKNYNLENVYIELKKLFILKKNYLVAPTAIIRQKILEIQDYELYADMSVEEVESALEQITVTTGLSQAVLNEGATEFLLRGDTELSTGIPLPFNIISTVFKGLRKGETMCYAMPSNSGKSRFAINLACYIAFVHKKKVLVISNEMSQEKMRLCMITTILNNPEIQKLHGQKVSKTEGELLELKFRADNKKRVKCDENGYIIKKEGETQEDFIKRLNKYSKEFRAVTAATEWLNTQVNNSIYFIHITEHSNDDLKKIILNYYYKEGIEYMFYDTLKADTDHIGNGDEIKKTATILSNIAQKFKVFICSSMQLLESDTLPVNLNINDMSASRTVKEVLDTLCLMKQMNRQTLKKYEYADTDLFEKCHNIRAPKDTDVRYYACVVDKNRAGAKPTVLFKLNLAYNSWEELGHLRLKQSEIEEE